MRGANFLIKRPITGGLKIHACETAKQKMNLSWPKKSSSINLKAGVSEIDSLPCLHFSGRKTNSRYMSECDLLQECKEITLQRIC